MSFFLFNKKTLAVCTFLFYWLIKRYCKNNKYSYYYPKSTPYVCACLQTTNVFLGGGSLGEGGFKYYEKSYRMYHLDC